MKAPGRGGAAVVRAHAAAERPDLMKKTSKFRGVVKDKSKKAKPWAAQIHVTEDGQRRPIYIGYRGCCDELVKLMLDTGKTGAIGIPGPE